MGGKAIREFAKRYRELALSPAQMEKRALWTNLNSLDMRRPLVYVRAIPYVEFFDESVLESEDPLLRGVEARLAQAVLFQQTLGDDFIFEPWVTLPMIPKTPERLRWGLPCDLGERPGAGGAAAYAPSLVSEEDLPRITPMCDLADEEETRRRADIVRDAIGDILDVHVNRQAVLSRIWNMDISTDLAKLRGLERMMWDIYDDPGLLLAIIGRMQAAILAAIDDTQARACYTLAEHQNQAMPYCRELAPPDPAVRAASARELWCFMASQEFTSVGPRQFQDFMLSAQRPIMERFGLSAYGCCEDLTHKIDALRGVSNLRRIAVSPFADVRACAERIGRDYVISYRPDPSAMISRGLDEGFVRAALREAFLIFKQNDSIFDITLKDVETIGKKPQNLVRWVQIAREEIARAF